jgi:hypothetical protein
LSTTRAQRVSELSIPLCHFGSSVSAITLVCDDDPYADSLMFAISIALPYPNFGCQEDAPLTICIFIFLPQKKEK